MMKFTSSSLMFSVGLAFATAAHAQNPCDPVLASIVAKDTGWRSGNTHSISGGRYAATDAAREKLIQAKIADMEKEILGKPPYDKINGGAETPPMEIFTGNGVTTKFRVEPKGGKNVAVIDVSGLGAKGELPATLVLPVSGHTGASNAIAWSKTDTYDLFAKMPDGKTVTLAKGAKSLDLVTSHEILVPMSGVKPGQKVTLEYHRSGSGGPGGYPEGRLIDIYWDGK